MSNQGESCQRYQDNFFAILFVLVEIVPHVTDYWMHYPELILEESKNNNSYLPWCSLYININIYWVVLFYMSNGLEEGSRSHKAWRSFSHFCLGPDETRFQVRYLLAMLKTPWWPVDCFFSHFGLVLVFWNIHRFH